MRSNTHSLFIFVVRRSHAKTPLEEESHRTTKQRQADRRRLRAARTAQRNIFTLSYYMVCTINTSDDTTDKDLCCERHEDKRKDRKRRYHEFLPSGLARVPVASGRATARVLFLPSSASVLRRNGDGGASDNGAPFTKVVDEQRLFQTHLASVVLTLFVNLHANWTHPIVEIISGQVTSNKLDPFLNPENSCSDRIRLRQTDRLRFRFRNPGNGETWTTSFCLIYRKLSWNFEMFSAIFRQNRWWQISKIPTSYYLVRILRRADSSEVHIHRSHRVLMNSTCTHVIGWYWPLSYTRLSVCISSFLY